MGSADRMRLVVRVVAALAVLAGGLIHLKLYDLGYKDFPNDNLGRSFLLNVVASVAIAVTLIVWRHWLVTVAALLLVNGTMFAFALSRTDHFPFGFKEIGFNPTPYAAWALVVEIVAAALLVGLLAWELAPADAADWRPLVTAARREAETPGSAGR
jgi:hypothetical protein